MDSIGDMHIVFMRMNIIIVYFRERVAVMESLHNPREVKLC